MAKRTVKWTRIADIQFVGILESLLPQPENEVPYYSSRRDDIFLTENNQYSSTPTGSYHHELTFLNISEPYGFKIKKTSLNLWLNPFPAVAAIFRSINKRTL